MSDASEEQRRSVVYVVAKAPRPGVSKTRLCPPLEPDQAARLAEAFLLDTLETVQEARFTPRVVCRDTAERAALEALTGGLIRVSAQAAAGLGDALEGAFREGLADGYRAVAVLGADSPTLPAATLREAFEALAAGADVALGPSDDGGYYLLAARRVYPELFRGMCWSTSGVVAETVRRCRRLGLRVQHLDTWYDVDDAAGLARLHADLARSPLAAAPRTRRALASAWMASPLTHSPSVTGAAAWPAPSVPA